VKYYGGIGNFALVTTMIPQHCNGMVQSVLDTVNSVQLKMKSKLPMMTDEAREKQIPPISENGLKTSESGLIQSNPDLNTTKSGFESEKNTQNNQPNNAFIIDPFTHEMYLTTKDWLILAFGTIFIVPIRAIAVILSLWSAWFVAKIGLFGLDETGVNVSRTGWRLKLMSVYGWFGTIIFWAAGFRISIKGKQAPRSEAPILVGAPHSSFLEALIIYMCGSSPVSRHENKTAFLISACQIFYQAIFVDRRSSETRRKALEDIRDRAQSSDNKLPQLFLCPEGTNTNRKVLIQFKIGAFAPGVPVQPVLIRYPGTERIDPTTWTYHQPTHTYKFSVWYILANPINRVEVEFLPVYTPNEEEKSKPELFAKNVQLIMAEALGVPATDISYGAAYKEYCKRNDTYIEDKKKN